MKRCLFNLSTLVCIAGCTNAVELGVLTVSPDPSEQPPVITALNTTELAVGDPLEFIGDGFVTGDLQHTEVQFVGDFVPGDGSSPVAVDFTVTLKAGSDGRLRWERFGGYRVPFHPAGNKLGVFEGSVAAANVTMGVSATPSFEPVDVVVVRTPQSAPLAVRIQVLPSLVVLDNRAVADGFVAGCAEPSTVLLETMRYALRVQALGFSAASFTVEARQGLLVGDSVLDAWRVETRTQQFRATGNGSENFSVFHRWAPVPQFHGGYRSSIRVEGHGVGVTRAVEFPFVVRPAVVPEVRPLVDVAELFPATSVSGCIPGGPASLQTSYAEPVTELRSRTRQETFVPDANAALTAAHPTDFSSQAGFAQNRLAMVPVLDLTTDAVTQSTTDVFSAAPLRGFETDMAWRRETASAQPTSALLSAVQAELDASPFGAVPGATRSWNDNESWSLRTAMGAARVAVDAGRTRGDPSRQLWPSEGASWGPTRSYRRQVGWAMDATLIEAPHFVAASNEGEAIDAVLPQDELALTTASSSEALEGQSAFVWAGMQGMWYRQTARTVQLGTYVVHDLCGNGTEVGALQLTDWSFEADMAIGMACPPATNLPATACFLEPCQR